MKNTRQCPKCQSRNVVKIPGLKIAQSGRYFTVGAFGSAKFDRYMCADCGFTEVWVGDPGQRKKVKNHFGIAK